MVGNATGELKTTARRGARGADRPDRQPGAVGRLRATLVGPGLRHFLELGSGRTLSGLVRQIDSDVETFSADSPKKLEKFAERSAAG